MTLYEFKLLNEEDQFKTIWDIGVHLDSIKTPSENIVLYAVDNFFVEVYYNATTNATTECMSFIEGERLNKYSNIPNTL